jgi:hypothetical protein
MHGKTNSWNALWFRECRTSGSWECRRICAGTTQTSMLRLASGDVSAKLLTFNGREMEEV